MKQKLVLLFCFAVFGCVACNGQVANSISKPALLETNRFPFVAKHDLDAGNVHGYVTLTADNPVIKAGERILIEVRFVNTGASRDFYNPYFGGLIAPPAQIALYDGNRKFLGDILSWVSGSFRGESWDDWTSIPGGGSYIGFKMGVKPNYARQPLPPGDYYLQFIYYKAFIALDPPWSETDPDVAEKQKRLKDFEVHFDRSELFRSNSIKFTIVK